MIKRSTITHQQQQERWEQEHATPHVLHQMSADTPSSGVVLFWEWLTAANQHLPLNGLEMGCGKGRNVIWLSEQGVNMTGFDFSHNAIQEAQTRAATQSPELRPVFLVHDAIEPWPFPYDYFDFVIDCFASTDIESYAARAQARDNLLSVLKPRGILFVYALSTDDTFHAKMIDAYPADEKYSFLHPSTGKFEKVFTRDELVEFYHGLQLIEERRIPKQAIFFGKNYACNHHWMIFKK